MLYGSFGGYFVLPFDISILSKDLGSPYHLRLYINITGCHLHIDEYLYHDHEQFAVQSDIQIGLGVSHGW